MAFTTRTMLLTVLLFCMTLAVPVMAEPGILTDEAQACLKCHAQRHILVTFMSGESVEAFVDTETFASSVHHILPCSQCHPAFSEGKHPKRTFRSKEQYQTKASLVCRHCHVDKQLRARAIHAALLAAEEKGAATVCTNCHGSHSIRQVTKTGTYSSEEEYCMRCHGYSVTLQFRNGESHSAMIDKTTLHTSVHNKLTCSDCHYAFSSEDHPKRKFPTRRDYTLASSENCRRCHFDKYTKTMESIHYTMLSQGAIAAPVCIDCHGSHGISHISKERVLIARRCKQCHAGIYEIYAKSVHGNALLNEHNQDVPVCTDCHTAHTIEDPRTMNYRERIPEMCSNCHANEKVVGKYGLSTAVIESYLADFHGITLNFYKREKTETSGPSKPIAVCTDCHGTHNISSTIGPEATIVKANLLRSCRRCHVNAPVNFPDSWLSHYQPSFARAPLVYIINLAYKIFIPILVIGLLLQILLHIWRYIINR